MQAEDLLQLKRHIPDLVMWVQCFSIYAAVLLNRQSSRATNLMAYAFTIAKASKKYKWPAWVVYDQTLHQKAANIPSQPSAKIDPSIYFPHFLGMAKSAEGSCQTCQSLDHTSDHCLVGSGSLHALLTDGCQATGGRLHQFETNVPEV